LTEVSVLFSEPKIPQFRTPPTNALDSTLFQCSSASRKFLNYSCTPRADAERRVSVLFSEPKIPQSDPDDLPDPLPPRFSALQRAENSSMLSSR